MKTTQNPQTIIDRADLLGKIASAQLYAANAQDGEVVMEKKYIKLQTKYARLQNKYIALLQENSEPYGVYKGSLKERMACKEAIRNSVLLPSGTRIIEFNPVYKVS
ncbi:MAG: hypothetical protein LBL90_07595 [Prevotellaceae bacterium]|jgi:hypothetical protein|nr:hypothetical protein [Prevotellaceae bacterium]